MQKNFYLTTTLPYVNAEPHIGFALEIVTADVICRYQRLMGKNVIFNTGTDEHGQKIYTAALEKNQTPQEYTDHYAATFEDLKKQLNLSYTHFIRTTNPDHKKAAQEFWKRCDANGYIYKKEYKVKYCVGCELEKQNSELEGGRCPLHPTKELENREEENYFFKFSAFQDQLLKMYDDNPTYVEPAGKMKEIYSFVEGGLQDFSISRLKEKMPWGVPVPGDEEHVMYVWFDALVNYISTLGWLDDSNTSEFTTYWPGVQIAGKDNLRQQAAMWQAMLMAAGVPNSAKILINGFISIDGQKMSKSLGNVISPQDMKERYGTDGTRYILMSLGPIGSDMDINWEKLDQIYSADLSNGLGNFCSRIAKMCEKAGVSIFQEDDLAYQQASKGSFDGTPQLRRERLLKMTPSWVSTEMKQKLGDYLETFKIAEAIQLFSDTLRTLDKELSEAQPWKKEGGEQKEILETAVQSILDIQPFVVVLMPEVGEKIKKHFSAEKIGALTPLFPRLG